MLKNYAFLQTEGRARIFFQQGGAPPLACSVYK